jgi:hypothetical protein
MTGYRHLHTDLIPENLAADNESYAAKNEARLVLARAGDKWIRKSPCVEAIPRERPSFPQMKDIFLLPAFGRMFPRPFLYS